MQNIYLIGFMGTGKTAVGKELAKGLSLQLADIDDLITEKEKRSINDIFVQDGEPYFRKIEKETLKEISNSGGKVVSCGGGLVIDPENIAAMKQTGKLVCLIAKPEVILERTKKYTHRPLLKVADPLTKISELLEIRQPYYAKADFMIDTSDLSVKQVVQRILEWLRR